MTEGTSGLSSIISAGVQFEPPNADGECLTCDGRGGELYGDLEGDGVWATVVWRFDPCPDCIGAGKCPGCGAPMTPEQQANAESDIETFTCSIDACSWHYDADRFMPDEDDYYEDDEPYGWDNRAVNGPYSDFSEGINDY